MLESSYQTVAKVTGFVSFMRENNEIVGEKKVKLV
jgi:hypothetical protein